MVGAVTTDDEQPAGQVLVQLAQALATGRLTARAYRAAAGDARAEQRTRRIAALFESGRADPPGFAATHRDLEREVQMLNGPALTGTLSLVTALVAAGAALLAGIAKNSPLTQFGLTLFVLGVTFAAVVMVSVQVSMDWKRKALRELDRVAAMLNDSATA